MIEKIFDEKDAKKRDIIANYAIAQRRICFTGCLSSSVIQVCEVNNQFNFIQQITVETAW